MDIDLGGLIVVEAIALLEQDLLGIGVKEAIQEVDL